MATYIFLLPFYNSNIIYGSRSSRSVIICCYSFSMVYGGNATGMLASCLQDTFLRIYFCWSFDLMSVTSTQRIRLCCGWFVLLSMRRLKWRRNKKSFNILSCNSFSSSFRMHMSQYQNKSKFRKKWNCFHEFDEHKWN